MLFAAMTTMGQLMAAEAFVFFAVVVTAVAIGLTLLARLLIRFANTPPRRF